jgi:hypothetical protein
MVERDFALHGDLVRGDFPFEEIRELLDILQLEQKIRHVTRTLAVYNHSLSSPADATP